METDTDEQRALIVAESGKAACLAGITQLFGAVRNDAALHNDAERCGATVTAGFMLLDGMLEAACQPAHKLQRQIAIRLFENVLSKTVSALYLARETANDA